MKNRLNAYKLEKALHQYHQIKLAVLWKFCRHRMDAQRRRRRLRNTVRAIACECVDLKRDTRQYDDDNAIVRSYDITVVKTRQCDGKNTIVYRIIIIILSYYRVFVIVLLPYHHRTVAFSPS